MCLIFQPASKLLFTLLLWILIECIGQLRCMQWVANLMAQLTARLFVQRPNKDQERRRLEEERNDAILDMAHELRRLNGNIILLVETMKGSEEQVSLFEKRFSEVSFLSWLL